MNSRKQIAFWLVVLTLLLGAGGVFAASATPEDYKKRVESARFNIELLLDAPDPAQEQELVAAIGRDLPATETIEWPGGSIVTENGWLGRKLEAFSNETDRSKRGAILSEVSERLLAISESTGELQNAVAGDRSKDQDKQKLAEILLREEYQKPKVKEESLFAKWLREFLEWLARVFPRPESAPSVSSGFGSVQFWLQVLIFALIIGLVGFLIYKLAPALFGKFAAKATKSKQDRVILGERIGADASASDLFTEAEQLARDGNLRAAIRKSYIALLCDLSDRKIVRLARHKTNRDYLRDVRKNDGLYENVAGLTRNFETNWYGLRVANHGDWEDFRDLYKRTITTVDTPRR